MFQRCPFFGRSGESFTSHFVLDPVNRLQRSGLDVDKNAVQRIESGQRFVTDIELLHLCEVLHTPLDKLLCSEE